MPGEEAVDKAPRTSLHGHWSSRTAFILAITGSAVGLGNIWKFPYIAGQNGGGAFVWVYVFCVFAIGMPVMMSEILVGRRGRRNPVDTMALLGEEEGHSRHWRWVGALGVLSGILILSYYSVVAGWTLAYVQKSIVGTFAGAGSDQVSAVFSEFTGSWLASGASHTAFMAITVIVVGRGVERGLEQAVKFLVPALLLLMVMLLAYSINSGSFADGVQFMFTPDFAALSWQGVLAAMGQACFTLSISMGAIMAFGAYLPEETSIKNTTAAVVVADTFIAILAGLIIFPLVIANNLDPADGPGLMFVTLPVAFGQMPGGVFFAALFFLLLTFAAWTSSLGLMEPAVAWMVEHRNFSRPRAALLIGGIIWSIGIATVLSFNVLSEFTFFRGTLYQNIDYVTSNLMLPLGGLLIAVFAAWVMCANSSSDELGGAGTSYRLWRFLARFVAPGLILVIFLQSAGILG